MIPRISAFSFMSSIPYWCHNPPAAPQELGMGTRIPQSICDAIPGVLCLSWHGHTQGIVTDLVGIWLSAGHTQSPWPGPCLRPTALGWLFLSPLSHQAFPHHPQMREGNLKPSSLYFDTTVTPPETLSRARSRNLVLINTCNTKAADTVPSLVCQPRIAVPGCWNIA